MVNAYFLDTSALVKRYVPEIGSDWILSITDPATNSDLVISQITWVEVHSAFARRLRDGSLSAERFDLIVQKVREDFENEYRVIDINPTLIETATELVIQHPLRAYDSVQLASALRFQSTLISVSETQLVFVSADNRLLNIAQSAGLAIDNPNNYP
ncbi:MAG: type II toxin-antitoxin system VapC family toxin [Microcoleus sp. PH2017_01_SCD_O_A]|uniref:type II toxin-antitoxin system VapC family toxin n=1 Tax=unclassified Microcoleus TaxID=2642155 RepID=UPI001D4D857F|nr:MULTISPECIES: type II toxin-antitoxin system VapC family toxin [unclassified Microcoleus]MCC3419892.1 type II toxin-antitoxin system VapC family toxin [Microcoleus sp. PH2017_07_MST_O_A]MCC3509668.1 type II toxin-antitoxin system VapC family toxin [Microcoleus sp. PH2017_17_BER_D_A]TAE40758.1 MAG: PIN domain-containing protein [Oscillatoriales cyanobacterium]MCC3425034.1 type II toxin-antitoxin system VapC family toxin [Microcoleus sp. PH2017_01_SCD_O_A]MCC3439057.1 type II toxin-antitoxin 